MGDASGSATKQKAGAKTQLKALAPRLAAALQAYATSKANPDEDLAGRVRYRRIDITQSDDASFATLVTALLTEAAPLADELAKREFTADELAETTRLLRRNTNLIKEMRVQLKPYQSSPTKHEVWLRFQGYTKLIVLGQGGPKSPATAKQTA